MKRTRSNNLGLFRFKAFNYASISAILARNSGGGLAGIFLRLIPVVHGKITPVKAKMTKVFLARASKVIETQGFYGLVKYLKACSVLLQQQVAGYKTNPQSPRVSRTNSGIPRILPVYMRRMIQRGNPFWIRFSLTLFALFRAITIKTEPKFSSITKPYSGMTGEITALSHYVEDFIRSFCNGPVKRVKACEAFPISTSSPQTLKVEKKVYFNLDPNAPKRHWISLIKSYASSHPVALLRSAVLFPPHLSESLRMMYNAFGGGHFVIAFDWCQYIFLKISKVLPAPFKFMFKFDHGFIGKLGLKQEAAGKMRVFAMVDPWTQWALFPIHDAIFKFLRTVSSVDGTFDQLGPLKAKLALFEGKPAFSMDLSSATDRLPISLQKEILQAFMGFNLDQINAWENLLVGRTYYEPQTKSELVYSVGQPMGAYSSWAMLALTHHFIVQVSAWKAGVCARGVVFTDYVVLGDDIVIFNAKVAKLYHHLMSNLGVECNLAKSIMSPKGLGLEFAKRTFFKGIDVSPVSLSEFSTALSSIGAMVEFTRKYQLSVPEALKAAGFGYQVLGRASSALSLQSLKVKLFLLSLATLSPETLLTTFTSLLRVKVSNAHFENFTLEFVIDQLDKVRAATKKVSELTSLSRSFSAENFHLTLKGIIKFLGIEFGATDQEKYHEFLHMVEPLYSFVYEGYVDKLYDVNQVLGQALLELRTEAAAVNTTDLQKLLDIFLRSLIAQSEAEIVNQDRLTTLSEVAPISGVRGPKLFRIEQQWVASLHDLLKTGKLLPTPKSPDEAQTGHPEKGDLSI